MTTPAPTSPPPSPRAEQFAELMAAAIERIEREKAERQDRSA